MLTITSIGNLSSTFFRDMPVEEANEYVFGNYTNQLGIYKYTFVEDNVGNYIFISVEKVNTKNLLN